MTYLSRVLYLVFSTDHSSYKSLLRLQRQLVNKYVFLLPLAEKIMKKQSRSLSAIPYGCEAMPHAACEIDLKKSLRECVGSLPLYAIMNALMCLTTEPKNFTMENTVEKEEDLCYQEPLLKVICATPVSLQAGLTPPGTDSANQHVTANYPLPAPPQLTGSETSVAPALSESKEESSDDSSSMLENKDQSFMLSLRPKKAGTSELCAWGKSMTCGYFHYYRSSPLPQVGFLRYGSPFFANFQSPLICSPLHSILHSGLTLLHISMNTSIPSMLLILNGYILAIICICLSFISSRLGVRC